MQTLRTPDERFANLPEFPYPPKVLRDLPGDRGQLRVAWVEDDPVDADPVLMLHGELSWSVLYRRMIPMLVAYSDSDPITDPNVDLYPRLVYHASNAVGRSAVELHIACESDAAPTRLSLAATVREGFRELRRGLPQPPRKTQSVSRTP